MIGLQGAWVPCAAHAIHNAVRHEVGGSGETAAQRASRLLTSGGRARRARTGCRNKMAREFLGRARGTIRFFEHSPVEALALSEIVVPEDVASLNLTQDVITRWGSTYIARCRLYTMWPRLSVFFRSTSLSAGQRKRKLLNRDWYVLRQMIAVLSPAFEVTNASEKSAATLEKIFFLVVALRKNMLEDALNVPLFPELPLAVGGAALETYIDEYPEDAVIEIDGRLYPCVLTFVDEMPGEECLYGETRTAVYGLRDKIDRMFFNTLDDSKNWLKNKAVLSSVHLTPGGAIMLREVAAWLEVEDPNVDAEAAVVHMCDKLIDARGTLATERTSGVAGGSGSASINPTVARMEACSSLTHWGTAPGATPYTSAAARPQSSASHARMELVASLRLSETAEREPPLPFWVRHRQQFPSLYILAGSFFGAVGSSSSCERAFLVTGGLVSEERSSLSVDSVEMHSLVAANMGMVPTQSSAVPTLTRAQARAFRDRMNSFVPEKEGGVDGVDEWSSGESPSPSDDE